MSQSDGKRKLSSDSGETPDPKTARNGGSPTNIIETIREANSILLDDSIQELCANTDVDTSGNMSASCRGSVFLDNTGNIEEVNPGSADANKSLDNGKGQSQNVSANYNEILQFMKRIDTRLDTVDSRLNNVEKKLSKLDSLESKVTSIDTDVKKLWVYVQDNIKSNDEKVTKCMDQIDELQFALGQANDHIDSLAKEQSKINEEMNYMRSQSMRNNLIFGNIPEIMHEKHADTETKVRQFMVHNLGLQQDVVDKIGIERAHRSTHPPDGKSSADFTPDVDNDDEPRQHGPPRKPRNIFVKFSSFKDRELVRKSSGNLKGSCYYVHEQFPKAVSDRRKALIPRLKEAVRNGHRAWLSYDTLYIDGQPQSQSATQNDADHTPSTDRSSRGAASGGSSEDRGGGNRGRGYGYRGRGNRRRGGHGRGR